ncbi:hypothetical protein JKF63_01099 [Porcisia hertigi]|uniref:Protein kinase domain-containing protein n=1 Tax=Porcisia hertigi TaxID=2761500 RepID=A0A836I8P5_9TRYP|nr:hypothetical protein JKF63_01099 [Porcisia hertigi]
MTLLPPRINVPATPALDVVDIHSLYDVSNGSLLGKGGFSEVLAVRHIQTNEIRALKVMLRSSLVGKKAELVAHEKEILRRTCHPSIVTLYETLQTSEKVYFALNLMNEDLFEFIVRNVAVNEDLSRAIMHQIMSGIAYLHEQSIVHRDIKPENILINVTTKGDKARNQSNASTSTIIGDADSDSNKEASLSMLDINKIPVCELNVEVKIADFGLAKVVMDWDVRSTPCGTSFYIAPEVIRAIEEQGAKPLCTTRRLVKSVDVWSAGVVFYVLLCGRPPFHGQVHTGHERRDLLRKIDHGVLFNSKHGWDSISAEAKDLILKMLEQNTSKRITSEEVLRHPFFTEHGYPKPVPAFDPRNRFVEMQKSSHKTKSATDGPRKKTTSSGPGSILANIKGFFGNLSKSTSSTSKADRQRMRDELAELQADVLAEYDVEGDVTSYEPTMPVKEAKPVRMAVMNPKAKVGPDALRK